MEAKMLLLSPVLLLAALFVAGEVSSATYHYSTHGNRAAATVHSHTLLPSRIRTRQTPSNQLHAQQPAVYSYQQQQQQQQQDAAAYPSSNLIFYPAHSSNPLVGQQQQQFRLQNPQTLQQPLAQQPQQLYQQQQYYQPQQLFQPQQFYQQQQAEAQQQQDPNQVQFVPGGVRYAFSAGGQQRRPAAPQVVEPLTSADQPAAPVRSAPQLGVSYSPATAVSTIKFSNPYANYSYG